MEKKKKKEGETNIRIALYSATSGFRDTESRNSKGPHNLT
jgi:hypothetical protein